MIDGNQLWDETLVSQLVSYNYYGKQMYTYACAPKNLYQDLEHSVKRYPNKVVIVDEDNNRLTFAQFKNKVDKLASYLRFKKNVSKGDKIALMLYNTPAFCIFVYAISKVGAVIVPINTKCKLYEWISLLSKLDVRLVFLDKRLKECENGLRKAYNNLDVVIVEDDAISQIDCDKNNVKDAYVETGWEDDLILMFTSGTTSKSKGVVLTNFNVSNAILSYEKILKISSTDKTVIATPIYHIIGIVSLLGLFVHCGGTIHLQLAYKPEKVLRCIIDQGLTLIHATPTVFIMLLEKQKEFPKIPSLRKIICGSANTPPRVIKELHNWIPSMDFHTVYGLTESSSAAAIFPFDAAGSDKIGSSGLPIPGMLMKIVNDDGNEMKAGVPGELVIYGNVILHEYYNIKNNVLSNDGWFKTGDIAKFDKDGYVYIVDRKKDMICRGGEKIWSNEVENIIYKLNGVAEAALIGVHDKKYGEVSMVVVKKRENIILSAQDVKEWVKAHMAKFKVPAYVVFVDELPKTRNGKIDKKALRDKYKCYGEE